MARKPKRPAPTFFPKGVVASRGQPKKEKGKFPGTSEIKPVLSRKKAATMPHAAASGRVLGLVTKALFVPVGLHAFATLMFGNFGLAAFFDGTHKEKSSGTL